MSVSLEQFPFKTPPFKHQLDSLRIGKDRPAYALFMEMGAGKSKVVIDNAAYLHLNNQIQGQVLVAPKGVYRNWVENEFPKHMSDGVNHQAAYWSSAPRKEEKEAVAKLFKDGNFLRSLVVNVEAANSERAMDEVVAFMKKYPSMITVDESTTIKNPNAKRTKILTNIAKFAKYRRICTGNPIPNGPLDLYAQAEFLKKNQLGFSNYFAYRNRFSIMQEKKFGNSAAFKTVVGYRDLEEIQRLMRQFSFIIKKSECLDLPPKVYQTVDVEMGPRQALAYQKMMNDAFIQLSETSQVSARMVITQLLRLHQITCGFLKPDGMQDEIPFGEPNERLDTLIQLLHQAPGKVIIWATYRYNIRQIIEAVSREFGPQSIVHFYGATTEDERKLFKLQFQDPDSPVRFIVSNPSSGKFGNTWTLGTTTIYYSNDYNLEARDQSEDRNHRYGQEGAIHVPGEDPSVLYIDLRVRGTVDDRIIKILRQKRKLTDEIVQSNWKWLIGEQLAA